MTRAETPEAGAPRAGGPPRSQWPGVIGTIGIILGILIIIDKIGDLQTLTWTEADWRRIFAPDIARSIMRTTSPRGWLVFSAVVQMALGVFLIAASVALRRRRRAAVALCQVWTWLAITWTVVALGRTGWDLTRHAGEIPGLWLAPVGMVIALVLILAFPVFLLIWLSRPDVRADVETWAD